MIEQNGRFLNFNKFLEERSVEISKFMNELQLQTKKKGHQSLPKSIRRRAMSHNRFRIPFKLRRQMQSELIKCQTMQKLPRCRKHIRKRRHLIRAFKLRNNKIRWLSTHLWASKRMKMIQYHGYKIAYTPNDKCYRSSYRHFRHNTCLVDLSYYQSMLIHYKPSSNNLSAIPSNNLSAIPSNILIQTSKQLNAQSLYQVQIYTHSDRSTFICPAYLIQSKNYNSQICFRVFFHPICLQEIKNITFDIEQYDITFQQSQIEMYLLLGPTSVHTFQLAMKKYGILHQQSNLNKILYSSNQNMYLFNQNCIQECKPMISLPYKAELNIKLQYQKGENFNIRKQIQEIIKFNQVKRSNAMEFKGDSGNIKRGSDTMEFNSFWDYYNSNADKNQLNIKFQITTRSRYTHKRKNKLTKDEKKKILSEKKEVKEKQLKEERIMMVESTPLKREEQKIFPVLVNAFRKNDLYQGCMVFCSNANSCKVWRILSQMNTKVIGRRQYLHLLLEANIPSFPEDYPTTKSFLLYQKQLAAKKFSSYLKIPTQKRPPYYNISSPFPFQGNQAFQNHAIISVEMISRGRCFQGSYICKIEEEDFSKIDGLLGNGKISIIHSQKNKQQVIEKQEKQQSKEKKQSKEKQKVKEELSEKENNLFEKMQQMLGKLTVERTIIGRITSGGFAYSKCKQAGIGFIEEKYKDAFKQGLGYVLIRKTTSPHYMLGYAKTLPNS